MRKMPSHSDVDYTVMVLPGAYASGVAVTLDMLHAAAVLAPRCGRPQPRWRVCSMAGGAVALSSSLLLQTEAWCSGRRADASTWIIPGWGVVDADALAQALGSAPAKALAQAVTAHVLRGGEVAASCSAVFLLHAAGVLVGRRFTTSWWLAPQLRQQLDATSAARLNADAMVCVDGPVVTAGAALAQGDLMLLLLRRRFGPALADAVSRSLLVDGRQAQAPFVVPALLSNGHAWVEQLLQCIEQALPEPPSVTELAGPYRRARCLAVCGTSQGTARWP